MRPKREEVRSTCYDLKRAIARQAWGCGLEPYTEEFSAFVVERFVLPEQATRGVRFCPAERDEIIRAVEDNWFEVEMLHRIVTWTRRNSGVSALALLRVWNMPVESDRTSLGKVKAIARSCCRMLVADDMMRHINADDPTDSLLGYEEA